MKSTWAAPISGAQYARTRRLLFGASVLLVFAFGMAEAIQAETFPISGMAGFETGLWKIANVDLPLKAEAEINWGDGTPKQLGLLKCGVTINPAFPVCFNFNVYGAHRYALAGTYTITVSYASLFSSSTEATTATILPHGDFVILSIGDSVASGEGNPIVPYDSGDSVMDQGYWSDPRSNFESVDVNGMNTQEEKNEWGRECHRSRLAGPAGAELRVQANNPAISVVHFACSGATVKTTVKNVSNAVSQLRIARNHLQRIDALLISAGANNLHGDFGSGFGDLLAHCVLNPPGTPCSEDAKFLSDINSSMAELQGEYAKLDQEIHCINPVDGMQEPNCTDPGKQIPKLVLITEYFDPTHDRDGNFPGPLTSLACTGAIINGKEWKFLYDHVVVPLNQQVRASPWNAVMGIQDDFLKHGYCAFGERWVLNIGDSNSNLGPGPDPLNIAYGSQGTGHPNGDGHAEYQRRIYNAVVTLNPPVTTASAALGNTPYVFGTWTNQDIDVTLSAKNSIKEAGLGGTFYAVDNLDCQPINGSLESPPGCLNYTGPFTISASGKHTITFFSANAHGNPEAVQSVQVWVDKNPPLSSAPGTMTIFQGQSASYTITVGHLGWAGQTIDLSCTTDAGLASCTMLPTSVTLDATNSNTSVATVVTTLAGGILKPPPPVGPDPFGLLGVLRLLLALATAAILAKMVRGLRRRRWAQSIPFAALALLFGVLCAGCNSAAKIPGTPQGTHTVTITGTSGMTSNSIQVKMTVK